VPDLGVLVGPVQQRSTYGHYREPDQAATRYEHELYSSCPNFAECICFVFAEISLGGGLCGRDEDRQHKISTGCSCTFTFTGILGDCEIDHPPGVNVIIPPRRATRRAEWEISSWA
jgi:hypothetical protein